MAYALQIKANIMIVVTYTYILVCIYADYIHDTREISVTNPN